MPEKERKQLKKRFQFFSLIAGIAIALISGLLENPPLVGATDRTYYGYPFVWVISRTGSTLDIRYAYLIVDAIFWILASFLMLALIDMFYYREPSYE